MFTAIRLLPTEECSNGWKASSSTTIVHETKEHHFDHVFSEHTNEEVFIDACRPIVERVLDGFNGTIAAYGQSGTGKTHTLLGTTEEMGILQMSVAHLLQMTTERTSVQYLVKMSAFEVYNETVLDLLDCSEDKKCRIVNDKVIDGKEEIVESYEHFLEIAQQAQDRRKVGETQLNQKSSRSHAVFQLVVESCGIDEVTSKQLTTFSKLIILDLAGSENSRTMTTSMQTAESRKINLSLLTLSTIITALSDTATYKHLPFRESKLTHILKPVLGGNSHFLLMCCIRKAASSETQSTIAFGQKAKKIKNHAKKNVEAADAALPALLAQISDLKRQLAEKQKEQDKERLEEIQKKVLNSKPEHVPPALEKAKRRHSIAFGFGGNNFAEVLHRRSRMSTPQNELNWEGLFRVDEMEVQLDSGRSSRMSADERPTTPEVNPSAGTSCQTDGIWVDSQLYEEMVDTCSQQKKQIRNLMEQLEHLKSNGQFVDPAAYENLVVEFSIQKNQLEKMNEENQKLRIETIDRKIHEEAIATCTQMNELNRELAEELDKWKRRAVELTSECTRRTGLIEQLADENEKLKSLISSQNVSEEVEKPIEKQEELVKLKDLTGELQKRAEDVEKMTKKYACLKEKAQQKLRERDEKYATLKEKGLEMLKEKENALEEHRKKYMMEHVERVALQQKLDEMTSATRGISSSIGGALPSCSNPDHVTLLQRCDVLVRQRELLIANINDRSKENPEN